MVRADDFHDLLLPVGRDERELDLADENQVHSLAFVSPVEQDFSLRCPEFAHILRDARDALRRETAEKGLVCKQSFDVGTVLSGHAFKRQKINHIYECP